MIPLTSIDVAESLRQSELLSRAQLNQLPALVANLSDDPSELAFGLVQRGWLTSYQAEQVLAGKTKSLVLGGYHLLEPLGTGGMSEVFKASQKRLNRQVAIKLIRSDLIDNPATERRFKREALAVAALSHPNIVQIYDFDQYDGTYFIVMEYVKGRDLDKLVRDTGPLSVELACDYIRQAALGLQHANSANIVHRDIKPANLLVAFPEASQLGSKRESGAAGRAGWGGSFVHGLVKILDMGIARIDLAQDAKTTLTRQGEMMGTPDFVSPEQARDASSVDIRADIYSLGCTFYFLLTGRPPFPGGNVVQKLMQHQMAEPVGIEKLRADVPAVVRGVVQKMMSKTPEGRYQVPVEVVEELAQILRMPNMPIMGKPEMLVPPEADHQQATAPIEPVAAQAEGLASSIVRTVVESSRDTPRLPDPRPPVNVVTAESLQLADAEVEVAITQREIVVAKKMTVLKGHSGPVMALAVSADSMVLASGGVDAVVRVWGLSPPREYESLADQRLGDLQVLAFSPNGQILVTGSASLNARMCVWPWRQGRDQTGIPVEGAPSFSDAMAFAPDGQSFASAVGSGIWIWGMDTPLRKRTVLRNANGDVKTLQFSPDGKQLVSGDAAGSVVFWKLAGWSSGRPSATWNGHAAAISCMVFSSDSLILATAGRDHAIRIWDAAGTESTPKVTLPEKNGVVRQMLFLPDTNYLLAATDSGLVSLWNLPREERDYEWRLDQPLICSMVISADGSIVATGNSDGTVSLFDLVPE